MPVPTYKQLEHSLSVLGIEHEANWPEVQYRYRQLVQQWHPDRPERHATTDKALAHERFIDISTAYNAIRDYHRKTGSIPKLITQSSSVGTAHIFEKNNSPNEDYVPPKSNWLPPVIVAVCVIGILIGILWSLDKEITNNNRERALMNAAEAARQINSETAEKQDDH